MYVVTGAINRQTRGMKRNTRQEIKALLDISRR
jgi:hypothetical protein